MIRTGTAVLAAMGMIAAATPALAQDMAWVSLAERTVGDGMDRDTINVRNPGRFRQLQICVDRAAVRFADVNLTFESGAPQSLRVRTRIGPGRCTRIFAVQGRDRAIATIELVYETAGAGGQNAGVMVLAR
jgi:hypothetical protein